MSHRPQGLSSEVRFADCSDDAAASRGDMCRFHSIRQFPARGRRDQVSTIARARSLRGARASIDNLNAVADPPAKVAAELWRHNLIATGRPVGPICFEGWPILLAVARRADCWSSVCIETIDGPLWPGLHKLSGAPREQRQNSP